MSQPDCLFCKLVAQGDHVHAADGFVAIRDIAPAAETHLLVLPERHVDTFRQIDEFPDEEAGRMLRFVAAVAAAEGLDDYRVIVVLSNGERQLNLLKKVAGILPFGFIWTTTREDCQRDMFGAIFRTPKDHASRAYSLAP